MPSRAIIILAVAIPLLGFTSLCADSGSDVDDQHDPPIPVLFFDCAEYYDSIWQRVPDWYDAGHGDSICQVADVYQSWCSPSYDLELLLVLVDMQKGVFDMDAVDLQLSSRVLELSEQARGKLDIVESQVLVQLATDELSRHAPDTFEHIFCLYASEQLDSLRKLLRKEPFKQTRLRHAMRQSQKLICPYYHTYATDYHVITGIWVPAGNASILGVRPLAGLSGGCAFWDGSLNLTIMFIGNIPSGKFLHEEIQRVDSARTQWGGFLGGTLVLPFVTNSTHQIGFLAQYCYGRFSLDTPPTLLRTCEMKGEDEASLCGHMIDFHDYAVGLDAKWYLNSRWSYYLGASLKLHYLSFPSHSHPGFSGPAVSFEICMGRRDKE